MLPGSQLPSPSFEVFTPRSEHGIDDLITNGRLSSLAALGPSFVGVHGNGLRILEHLRCGHCIRPQLHLPRTRSTAASVVELIDSSLPLGIRDVLILGGRVGEAAIKDGFATTLDLVCFVKERYGARIRVAVCGYPCGARGECGDYDADLSALARQVSVGAELVVCMPCFDAQTHSSYVSDARGMGVSVPVLPGVLLIRGPAGDFRRICRSIDVEIPAWLERRLKEGSTEACVHFSPRPHSCAFARARSFPSTRSATCRRLLTGCGAWDPLDRSAIGALGKELFVTMLRELAAQGAAPPHVYTLNSADVLDTLSGLGYRPLKHRA